MTSQAEEKKRKMVKRVYDKLSKAEKAPRFRYNPEALDDTFEHASQSSLVELIKSPQHSCLGPPRLSRSSKVQFQVQIGPIRTSRDLE